MDEISLALPQGTEWRGVAYLVLSGLAARLDLTVEALEDWALALCELFARLPGGDPVEIIFRVSPESFETHFGPVNGRILAELNGEDEGEGVGLRRVLTTVTDSVRVESKHGGDWVVLRKAVVHPEAAH